MLDHDLTGIIAATVLPQTLDLEIDTPALRSYLDWLLGEGVHGLAVNVDTGEGPALTHEERKHVIEVAAESAGGRVPVVAGLATGAGTDEAIRAARDFGACGANALLVFPPPGDPVAFYRAVGEGADVPLVLFQLQEALGGTEYPVETLVAIASLPHVVAIKEATFRREDLAATLSALADVEITVLSGNDNFLYESLRLGAEGLLIGFGTVAVGLQVEMAAAHAAGDAARAAAIGERVQKLADVVFGDPVGNYRARLKEALTMTGVIPRAVVRPPLTAIPDAEREAVRAALVETGIL